MVLFITRGKTFGSRQYPPTFKAAGKRPVPGGRWFVRRVLPTQGNHGKTWFAWTKGMAPRPRAKYFHTFGEAITYAQRRARGERA